MIKLLIKIKDLVLSVNSKIKWHPYARNYLFYYWAQYLLLYFVVRILKSKHKYNWIYNIKFIVDVHDWAFARNCYLGLNEFNDSCFALHYLRKNDLFLDIGANLGHYTLLASKVTQSNVICFEPDNDTFAKLEQNIRINKLEKLVQAFNFGLGEKSKDVAFITLRNNGHNYISNSKKGNKKVTIVTLDQLKMESSPKLMKIDVEGYEKKVLEGGRNLLKDKSLNALIIEVSNHCERYGDKIEDVFEILIDLGFSPYHYNPFNRDLIAFEVGEKIIEQNIIFIRRLPEVNDLLKNSKMIRLDSNFQI